MAGVTLRNFGAADGVGGTEKGITIATRAGAPVSAPADGWVVYAGPFRSYGQLLIINAGGGYHILMAGMERITVDLGQFVLAGEPVGVMGGLSRTVANTVQRGPGASVPGEVAHPPKTAHRRPQRPRDSPNCMSSSEKTGSRSTPRHGGRQRTVGKFTWIMRRTSLFLFGVAAGALVAVAAVQPRLILGTAAEAASSDTYKQLNLFGDVFERVRSDYVEKPDDAKLIEAAINGMLQSLDPHSSYMDAKNHRDMHRASDSGR